MFFGILLFFKLPVGPKSLNVVNSVFFFFPSLTFSGETIENFPKKTILRLSQLFFFFLNFVRVQNFVQNNLTGGNHPQEDLAKFG
jgi:hypothetical protein